MKTTNRFAIVALPLLLAFACDKSEPLMPLPEGGAGGTLTGGTGGTTNTLCESEPETTDHGWQRLSGVQYRNSLNDFFIWLLGPSEGKAFIDNLKPDIDEVVQLRPKRFAKSLSAIGETEAELGVAIGAAQLFATLPPDRLFASMEAPSANADGVAAWVRQFAAKVAARAFRAPPDVATVNDLASAHPSSAQLDMSALGQIVGVVLSSPEFLFRIEHGAAVAVAGHALSFPLSPFELASRVSYHLWNAPPDAQLMQVASDGSLLRNDVYEAELARMLADPRAHPTIREFLYQMLDLDSVADPVVAVATANYKAFAGADLPTPALRQHVIDEALDMGDFSFFAGETYATLLQVGRSFARTADLARLYGAPVWDGQSAPPALDNRPGILSHGWLTVAPGLYRHQMLMGMKIRNAILCDDVPLPPPNVTPASTAAGLTRRETIEQIYQTPSCRSCHNLMATLAYPFEGFDALGRVRTQETVYDAAQNPVGTKPVNTASVPRVIFDDDREVDGAAQLVQLMLESDKVFACLSRHLNTFAFPTNGSCAIDTVRDRARRGTLLEAFAATARLRAFSTRAIEPPKL